MKTKIIVILFMISLAGLAWYGINYELDRSSRIYADDISFDDIDEAYDFQKIIIDEATVLDYDVLESDITISSPPKFSFEVLTDGSKFEYGKRIMSDSIVELIRTIATAGIVIATISGVYSVLYYKKDSYE